MAELTNQTFLKYRESDSGTWEVLCDIITYPELISPPAREDATTLSNTQRTYIPGLKDSQDLTFETSYVMEHAKTITELEGKELFYRLEFGPEGSSGSFEWKGEHVYTPASGSVGEIRKASLTCYPSTEIQQDYTGAPGE